MRSSRWKASYPLMFYNTKRPLCTIDNSFRAFRYMYSFASCFPPLRLLLLILILLILTSASPPALSPAPSPNPFLATFHAHFPLPYLAPSLAHSPFLTPIHTLTPSLVHTPAQFRRSALCYLLLSVRICN